MASIQSKLFRFVLKNRHWLNGQFKAPVINSRTSIDQLRADVSKSAARMAKMPEGVLAVPSEFRPFYAEWVIPQGVNENQAILYFHGSGFVMGTSRDHRALVAKFAARCGVKALVFDYSLAPERPHPAAINDSLAIYKWMLETGYLPENILFVGDSAGACIALSTLLALKEQGYALPKAVVTLSPCSDLTCSGESHITKAKKDPATPQGANETFTRHYIGNGDPASPEMSPLFGNLSGLPPIMIQVGEDETMLDDSVRFAKRAEAAGVDASLHVWEGMFHCFPLLAPMFPEATKAMDEICAFIRYHLEL